MSIPASFDPEQAENLEDIEKQFAVKAVHQAETYWNLLEKIPGSKLKLSKYDDDIYDQLMLDFPEFRVPSFAKHVDEEWLKSKVGKDRWRPFCEKFNHIEDYNFGTLLRTDSSAEYGQDTTIFVVRIQFYAIEIVRNRAGLNDWACAKK